MVGSSARSISSKRLLCGSSTTLCQSDCSLDDTSFATHLYNLVQLRLFPLLLRHSGTFNRLRRVSGGSCVGRRPCSVLCQIDTRPRTTWKLFLLSWTRADVGWRWPARRHCSSCLPEMLMHTWAERWFSTRVRHWQVWTGLALEGSVTADGYCRSKSDWIMRQWC